ncbi:Transposon TX1 uncharacterized [Cucumis melo var. makuwa]|uniref:Transposon TX1 uncharacterized n=1 Tax=Cucumis melo var. makuwa TaxID=1194695 RepID=A0A5D3BDY1_CUCMM|nr:Transposon TX1 uncharacterized [Cucumis melo var. makuwa]
MELMGSFLWKGEEKVKGHIGCEFGRSVWSNFFEVFGFMLALHRVKESASMVKELRPVSLIISVYKILAKVLANQLRKVMSSTIFEVQGALLAGRQILD